MVERGGRAPQSHLYGAKPNFFGVTAGTPEMTVWDCVTPNLDTPAAIQALGTHLHLSLRVKIIYSSTEGNRPVGSPPTMTWKEKKIIRVAGSVAATRGQSSG